jgi:Cytochrome c
MIVSTPFRTLKPTALLFVAMLLTASVGVAQDADGGELGATTYASACLACHQATGLGLPGVFPPLAGHAPALLGYEGSREYIANLSLYGLQGEIVVLDATYNQVLLATSRCSTTSNSLPS